MALNDEAECEPYTVSEYHFLDDKDECVSFHILPVQWSNGERQGGVEVKIFLHATTDNGGNVCNRVIAWKFDVSSDEPEILVLSEENSWFKLGKPRKSFEEIVRSILITVHCIHYVKRNPEKSGECVWNHLSEGFRLYEDRPSESDLLEHMPVIGDCVKRYPALADSKFLAKLFEEKTMKRKPSDEDTEARKKLRVIIDDMKDGMIDHAEDEDNDNLFGEVCALCDDGGDILCCEGGCLRSFHGTEEAGAGSYCKSLGFMQEDVVAIQNFYCKNCEHKQHQCFVCGKLGSSDKSSGAAEVVSCASPICGRFYHPHCVAILLYQDKGVPAKELERKIADGEFFNCPIHKCCICKQGENKKDSELQFAVCMRCPKSYHRKCLPREIAFENQVEVLEGRSLVRAWNSLLPNRILIYCTNHDIDIATGTVRRDHIKFPDVKQNMSTLKKKTILEAKWKPISEFLVDGNEVVAKRILERPCRKTNAPTALKSQEKKNRKLMSEKKPVSKKSNLSWEESVGERSDPVLSQLVKRKLSPVKEKKTTFVKDKSIVEEKDSQLTSEGSVDRVKALLKRTPSSEGLCRKTSAPTISKQKPLFVEEKNNNLVKNEVIVEEKRKLMAELLVDRDATVSKKKDLSSGSCREQNASTTPEQKQKPSSIQEKKTSLVQRKTIAEEKKKLTSELTTNRDEAGSKKGSPLEESLSAIASMVPKMKQKLTSAVKLGSNKNRKNTVSGVVKQNNSLKPELQISMSEKIKSSLVEEPFSSMESEQVEGCKRQNSNGPNQKLRTEFDRIPQDCIKGKQVPKFSTVNDLSGLNWYDHIRTFSSTFYSHIGPVADSLSSSTRGFDPRVPHFAPGPHLNYSLQNSAGWIDE